MIFAVTSFAYPDYHYDQVVALDLPFHDQHGGGPVYFLAFDGTKEELVQALGLSGELDKYHALVLRVPRHKWSAFDSLREWMEANGMLERLE